MNPTPQVAPNRPATAPAAGERRAPRRRSFAPRVDVLETKEAFVLVADVPGVSQSSLDVVLDKERLTIEGRVETGERAGHRLRRAEYECGDFRRTFAIPEGIDRDRVEATVKNGVLRLTLPKAVAVLPRRIAIQPAA